MKDTVRRPSSRQRFASYLAGRKHRNDPRHRTGRGTERSTQPLKGPVESYGARDLACLLRGFFQFLGNQRWVIGFTLFGLTAAMLMRMVPPFAVKLIVDAVLVADDSPWWAARLPFGSSEMQIVLQLAVGAFGIAVCAAGTRFWVDWHSTRAIVGLQMKIQRKLWGHILRLPLNRVQALKSGAAVGLLRVDSESVAMLLRKVFHEPWQALVQVVASLLVLFWVDWRLVVCLLIVPGIYFSHRRWIGRVRRLYADLRSKREYVDSLVVESMSGIRIVRTFGQERCEQLRLGKEHLLQGRHGIFAWRYRRCVGFIWELLVPLATMGLLVYGSRQVLNGQLTMGEVSMFLMFSVLLLVPLYQLINSISDTQSGLAALDRILDLLEEPVEFAHARPSFTLPPDRLPGALVFKDVGFTYPGSESAVLKHINLEISDGETLALVGASGAGKTTLCHLVCRLYDPTQGYILLNGVDLRSIELESYRRMIAIVEQDVTLFDDSLYANIAYGRPDAAIEEIEEASRLACAHEFVQNLEHGYDTLIGERGVKLSGGQRQRIAIARAILADPRILILDEATSNLDANSERLIQQSLSVLTRNRSSIIIAHRLSTIAFADRIIVMNQGQIVESGTHRGLMSQDSCYRELVQTQVGTFAPAF